VTAIQVGLKDALYLDDVQHRVVERLDDGRLVLETISDGRRRAVTDDDLARALAAGSLRIVRAGMATNGTTILGDFQELPEEKKFCARRRHRYLSEVTVHSPVSWVRPNDSTLIPHGFSACQIAGFQIRYGHEVESTA